MAQRDQDDDGVGDRLGRDLRARVLEPARQALLERRDRLAQVRGGALLEAARAHMTAHELTSPLVDGHERLDIALRRSMQAWTRGLAAANRVINPGEVACYNALFDTDVLHEEFAQQALAEGSPARQPLPQLVGAHLAALAWAAALDLGARHQSAAGARRTGPAGATPGPELTVMLFVAYKEIGERYVMSDRQTDRDELHGLIRGLSLLRLFAQAAGLGHDRLELYKGLEAAEARPREYAEALEATTDWSHGLVDRFKQTPR